MNQFLMSDFFFIKKEDTDEISELSYEDAIKNTSENHPRAINVFNRI